MSEVKLPEGWIDTYIGEIAEIVAGGTPKSGVAENFVPAGTGIAWLTPADLSGYKDKTISYGARDLSEIGYKSSSAKLMPQGSLLFSSRAPIGYVVIAENNISTNQGFKNFLFTEHVISDYAYYYLRSIRHIAEGMGTGTTFKEISGYTAKSLPFRIAPLAEQKIIADKLDTLLAQVDSTKTRLEKIAQILKDFRQAVLTAAVKGKLTTKWREEENIPSASWCTLKASDVCLKIQSGSTPTGQPFDQNGTIPFLKVYNIVNQKIDFDYRQQYITDEVHRTKSKRSIAFPNDILMNIVGPPLGKIAILSTQYPEWNLNQAITLFRVNSEILVSKYLYYFLCEGELVRSVMHDTKGIVGQINISLTQCREAQITCPSLKEQAEIVRRIEQLFAYADDIEKQTQNALERVSNLTQSILAKAFRGELTAQWRAENPDLISGENSAQTLLEKIQQQRTSTKTIKRSKGNS